MARLCPLFSGSKGNAYYIGSKNSGILIDAGVSCRRLVAALTHFEIDPKRIEAIFITHEHRDHIAGLQVFAACFQARVYASPGTMQELEWMGIPDGRFIIEPIDQPQIEAAGMQVTPFRTSHDSVDSVGYRVVTQEGRTAVFATDTGRLTDEMRDYFSTSDFVVLESNHDVGMLENGRYPYPLKRRILSDVGHLSNEHCAQELPGFVQNGATRLLLAHLSEENNIPLLARQAALSQLQQSGMRENVDFKLMVAARENRDMMEYF